MAPPEAEPETEPEAGGTRPVDDLERVRRSREGDPEAVRWLEERLLEVPRNLHRIGRRFGGGLDVHELDDLAQETMLKAWHRLDRFTGQAPLGAWLHRFCTYEYLNALRRQNRRPRTQELETALPAPAEARPVALDELAEKLQRLAPEQAQVIELRHMDGLDFEDVGAALGITAAAAKTRYYRVLRHLRGLFGPTAPGN